MRQHRNVDGGVSRGWGRFFPPRLASQPRRRRFPGVAAADLVTFDLEWAPDALALAKQNVTIAPPCYIEYSTPLQSQHPRSNPSSLAPLFLSLSKGESALFIFYSTQNSRRFKLGKQESRNGFRA